jgi:hypothetical protein
MQARALNSAQRRKIATSCSPDGCNALSNGKCTPLYMRRGGGARPRPPGPTNCARRPRADASVRREVCTLLPVIHRCAKRPLVKAGSAQFLGMTSESDFQPLQWVTDPHEFPASSEEWHSYRRWLARVGRRLPEQMESAPSFPEREALDDLTGRAEVAFQEFQVKREDVEYAEYARRLAGPLALPAARRQPSDPEA